MSSWVPVAGRYCLASFSPRAGRKRSQNRSPFPRASRVFWPRPSSPSDSAVALARARVPGGHIEQAPRSNARAVS